MSTRSYQLPRGTHDVLPQDIPAWRFVEETFREVCRRYGFAEIRTPLFEHTELFARATGASSDVMVTKQMYNFVAPDEQSYTLRPEGTAGVVRAYLEHRLAQAGAVTKLFYVVPVFRYEAPQSGRYRQHHQCGVEMLGAATPEADAEIIALAHDFLRALGIAPILHINSLGTVESRAAYVQSLRDYLTPHRAELSEDSQKRLELNPLRVFDSKDEADRRVLANAPRLLAHLQEHDAESSEHFARVCRHLETLGIPYKIDHDLVRGFDYYSRTAFEFVSENLGAQSTVLGGGRYDGLVEELGGASTPGIGFGAGIERLLLERAALKLDAPTPKEPLAFLVTMGDAARESGVKLLHDLRVAGLHVEGDVAGRGTRAQFREADRRGARFTLILGEDEVAQDAVALKNMESGEQQTMPRQAAVELLENLLELAEKNADAKP